MKLGKWGWRVLWLALILNVWNNAQGGIVVGPPGGSGTFTGILPSSQGGFGASVTNFVSPGATYVSNTVQFADLGTFTYHVTLRANTVYYLYEPDLSRGIINSPTDDVSLTGTGYFNTGTNTSFYFYDANLITTSNVLVSSALTVSNTPVQVGGDVHAPNIDSKIAEGASFSANAITASNFTANPVGYIWGTGTLSGTSGTHDITFGTAQTGLHIGWNIATLSDNGQYFIADITDSTHIKVFQVPQGGGLAHTYTSATNWYVYHNAHDFHDIDGNPAGGVANDGTVFSIGNQGLLHNSGGFVWANGVNSYVSYVANDGNGHPFWSFGSFTNNSQVHIFGGAPNSSFELLNTGVASIAAGVTASTAGRGFASPLYTPASSSETNIVGAIRWDSSFIYVWTATNVNKRAALSTW